MGAMLTDPLRLYDALLTRDARFDGRVFVGVTSTGIYCRPVCRVRTPRLSNCRFFANAALAEHAGFRPCLRCRPELAPGLSLIDSPQALAQRAAHLLADAALDGQALPLPTLAARLGVSERHLRRIFVATHGVSPLAYLSTCRLLHAKQLLTDTDLPVTAVAYASGYGSLRRFNAVFAERYRMNPSTLRRQGGRTHAKSGPTVVLSYRPPYDVDGVLRHLRARCVVGVESVLDLTWSRSLSLAHRGMVLSGWISACFEPECHRLRVDVAPTLAPVLGAVVRRLRQALDLDADPALIAPVLQNLPTPVHEGVRVPGGVDGFETAVRIILGQQVSVAAACTLAQRLVDAFGEPLAAPLGGVQRLFPSAAALSQADPAHIGRLGIVRQRVTALQALARAVESGELSLTRSADLPGTLATLRALPGVGEWTTQLIAMRALAWPDAFAAQDLGVLRALGETDHRLALARAEAWRPWRAYAQMSLWQSLETSP